MMSEQVADLERELAERNEQIDQLSEQLIEAERKAEGRGRIVRATEHVVSTPVVSQYRELQSFNQTFELRGYVDEEMLTARHQVSEQVLSQSPGDVVKLVTRDVGFAYLKALGRRIGVPV